MFFTGLILVLTTMAKSKPDNAVQTKPTQTSPVQYGPPVTIEIPRLGVKAQVEAIGLTPQNDLDVPSQVANVGWYKYGAQPGNKGTAVIDGHYDGPNGQPAVFFDLDKLRAGDKINVSDGQNTATFVVKQTKEYGQLAHPQEVFDSGMSTHLNLITCSGAWDKAEKRYDQRLVVFADLEGSGTE